MNLEIPQYSPQHYKELMAAIDPVEIYGGYSIKRGDAFHLGPIQGSKVRQCLFIVHSNLDYIKKKCNAGILTAAGLPSPQTMIVSAVAKYFGLKCAITTPKYENGKIDFNRINSSVAQKLGAVVYGVGNPNPAGPECDAKHLVKELGYYQVKFGMCGDLAMEPVARQVQNIPKYVTDIVIISGSGLSALSIMRGLSQYPNKVKTVWAVCLSKHILENKKKWYDDPLAPKCNAELRLVDSPYAYRTEYKWNKSFDFDITYESKAFKWMTENLKKTKSVLFWVVGKKLYDLDLIEPIDWHTSQHEYDLRNPKQLSLEKFFI